MVIVLATVAPFSGDVIDVLGGVVSEAGLETVTFTDGEVLLLLAASYAFEVKAYIPFEPEVVFQENEYGDVVSEPKRIPSR